MLRAIAQGLALGLLIGLLVGAPSPAGATTPTVRKDCIKTKTHRACITLHRNDNDKIWATGFVKKLRGRTNHRDVALGIYTRACNEANWVKHDQAFDEANGDRTARASTPRRGAPSGYYFRLQANVGWSRVHADGSHISGKVHFLRTNTLSTGC